MTNQFDTEIETLKKNDKTQKLIESLFVKFMKLPRTDFLDDSKDWFPKGFGLFCYQETLKQIRDYLKKTFEAWHIDLEVQKAVFEDIIKLDKLESAETK